MRRAVVPFSAADHLGGSVRALLQVRAADPTYPPARDAGSSAGSFADWLMDSSPLARWAALADGAVVGHVLVEEPHDYIIEHMRSVGHASPAGYGIGEIAKLFVCPLHGRRGIGTALFRTACRYTWEAGRQPTLAVVVTSQDAIRFYEHEQMRDVGGFHGVHGENRVLVQDDSGLTIETARSS